MSTVNSIFVCFSQDLQLFHTSLKVEQMASLQLKVGLKDAIPFFAQSNHSTVIF